MSEVVMAVKRGMIHQRLQVQEVRSLMGRLTRFVRMEMKFIIQTIAFSYAGSLATQGVDNKCSFVQHVGLSTFEGRSMRLSIDITPEQHQRLKAIAALQGQSMKDYVLTRIFADESDSEALRRLEAFLEPRLKAAQGESIDKTVTEIFEATLRNEA